MKLLIVASNKGGDFSPFVAEQKDALIRAGIQVASYPHSAHGIMNYIREIKYLRCAIKREKPNVVHAHFGLTGLMATLAAIGMRVPVVVTYHGCDINDTKLRPFSRVAMWLADWNIFVSRRQMMNAFGEERKAVRSKKWSIIPCGVNVNYFDESKIDTDWFNSLYSTQNKVLFAGSFDSIVKNASLAKQAVEIYNAMHPNAMVDLIELRGYTRDEVVTLMHMCKSLLLTSIREGSPQVVKEAMACGCPIVSVDVGDVAERVDGVEGCYVVASRDPQDLAKALARSVHFGRTRGKEKLLEASLDNAQIADRLIDIYTKIIKK
jgi:glycosyltransferase involved in cell wall biosynthesis